MSATFTAAEREAYLLLIEKLSAEIQIERALNANLQAGLDALTSDLELLKAELRRWQSDAMTDHEVRTLGLEHTSEGLRVRA